MKNNKTEIVFILDRSGSMAGLESDTIGGFNAMLAKQKALYGECYVTTYLFDHASEMIHDRLPLKEVENMTSKIYTVRGSTALLDAIGGAIEHIEGIHKYIRPEDVPQNTIFVITTDGMENASTKFSSEKVKVMIEGKKADCGWEFIFLGANIDAVETAGKFGISADHAVDYLADSQGTSCVYSAVSDAVMCMRYSGAMPSMWRDEIDSDYKKRKNHR